MSRLIRDGRAVSRAFRRGRPAYVFARECKILLPGPNLWWPTAPSVTSRAGLQVTRLAGDRWRLTGVSTEDTVFLGGWYEIAAGTYRLDAGVSDPRIRIILSGVSTIAELPAGRWLVRQDTRILLYLKASGMGESFDTLLQPTMVRTA